MCQQRPGMKLHQAALPMTDAERERRADIAKREIRELKKIVGSVE